MLWVNKEDIALILQTVYSLIEKRTDVRIFQIIWAIPICVKAKCAETSTEHEKCPVINQNETIARLFSHLSPYQSD